MNGTKMLRSIAIDGLDMPNAAAELVKAQLTFQIAKRIKAPALSQTQQRPGLVFRRRIQTDCWHP
jgi:hypothetical protein